MCARILVVDDDPTNVSLLSYLLRAFGHEPVNAYGGREALDIAAREALELVLCDVQMPEVDGFEVLRQLRARTGARMPVVAVSALAMVGDREKILAAGFDGYLEKPIDPEQFIPYVERFLPSGSIPGEAVRFADPSPAMPRAPAGGVRVLVVDDLKTNRELLRRLLESAGMEVFVAKSGSEGYQCAVSAQPSIIVCDLHMDDGDGLDLLRSIRNDERLRDTPFLLLSASSGSVPGTQEALDLGANAFLRYPLEHEDLLAEIRKWVAKP